MSPRSSALTTAWVRVRAPSFSIALRTWDLTVSVERKSLAAMSAFVLPPASSARTSHSRRDKPPLEPALGALPFRACSGAAVGETCPLSRMSLSVRAGSDRHELHHARAERAGPRDGGVGVLEVPALRASVSVV